MGQEGVKPGRRRLKKWLGLTTLVLSGILLTLAAALTWVAPRLRSGIEAALSDKTGRSVRLGSFDWALWPRVRFRGEDLVIGARTPEGPPLVSVGSFSLNAGFSSLLGEPRRIDVVEVDDLHVHIPQRDPKPVEAAPPTPHSPTTPQPQSAPSLPVALERIVARNAVIEIAPSRPDKPARIFHLQELTLNSFDLRATTPFQARLRYPRPEGDLAVAGTFGPWNSDNPKATPYRGDYRFTDADMSDFKGIAGALTTSGSFEGSVEETVVRGVADIPDFSVVKAGKIVPLHVVYDAAVHENGRVVELVEVDTSFFDSRLISVGEVTRHSEIEGRIVSLNVVSQGARVEDLLQFAVKSETPPLTGAIELDADVLIPPGRNPFIERLRVDGEFMIREGLFNNVNIQETLAKISRIGGGESEGESGSSVVSDMEGRFVMENKRIDFSRLDFGVPGMKLELTGSYVLDGEQLDFRGRALLERAPSEMVSDKLSKWIKIIDPILRGEKAGTVIPVKISGTRSKPKFSVDFGRLGRSP